MSFFGKWTAKAIMTFGEDGPCYLPIEEIRGTELEEDYSDFMNMVVVISPESMDTYAQIPEDQIEEAKAEGVPVTEYGVLVQSNAVKEENGEYFYAMGDEGMVMGEEISPFEKLELDEEGLLPYAGGMVKLKKED